MAETIIAHATKVCVKCKASKFVTEFGRHAKQRDGWQRQCTECQRAYFAAYRDAHRNEERRRAKEFRERHPDRVLNKLRAFREANRERSNGYSKKWQTQNPEARTAALKRDKLLNAERDRITRAKWCAANLPKLAAKQSARRALRLRATPPWADEKAIAEIYEAAARISSETGIEHHVDHSVPLKAKLVCGLHCEANLEVIPARDNLSKCNRHWPDMP